MASDFKEPLWSKVPTFISSQKLNLPPAYTDALPPRSKQPFAFVRSCCKPKATRNASAKPSRTYTAVNQVSESVNAVGGLSLARLPMADRQRLATLVHSLAVAQTQKKQLETTVAQVATQKRNLEVELGKSKHEATDYAQKQLEMERELQEANKQLRKYEAEIRELRHKMETVEDLKIDKAVNVSQEIITDDNPVNEKLDDIQGKLAKIADMIPQLIDEKLKKNHDDETTIDKKPQSKTNELENVLHDILQKNVSLDSFIASERDESTVAVTSVAKRVLNMLNRRNELLSELDVSSHDATTSESVVKPQLVKNPMTRREYELHKFMRDVGTSPVAFNEPRKSQPNTRKRTKKPVVSSNSTASNSMSVCALCCPTCNGQNSQRQRPTLPTTPVSPKKPQQHSELLPIDSSYLFANDTSMVKSLVEIVQEIEGDKPSVIPMNALDDLMDVISSLNEI